VWQVVAEERQKGRPGEPAGTSDGTAGADGGGAPAVADGGDRRLSEPGTVAAVAAVACPTLALLAWAAGEWALVVGTALLGGGYAAVLVARDVRTDRPPSPDDHLWLGGFCGFAAAAGLVGGHWLTAAGLGLVALMQVGRWRGWKVKE
jgi:hypothetical protein